MGLWWQRGVQVMGLCGAAASLSRLGVCSPRVPTQDLEATRRAAPTLCIPSLKLVAEAAGIPMGTPRPLCGTAVPVRVLWSLRGPTVLSGRPPLSPEPGGMAGREGWALRGLRLSLC